MLMTKQQHQGLHGEGYVFALASAAGLVVSRPGIDLDTVDWIVSSPGPMGTARSPKIELQVKSCSDPVGSADSWTYRLKRKHFNNLAGPGFVIPRYLVLVTVPTDAASFAVCAAECMRLHHAAYWASLVDEQPIPDGADAPATVAVRVPKRNLLTPASLVALVAGKGLGEEA